MAPAEVNGTDGTTDDVTSRVGSATPFFHPGFSEESCRVAMEDRVDPTDVFVLTAPKTGTTFLQVVCHFLRTGGEHSDFEDIYQVSPWDQMAWDLDLDLRAEPVCPPRVFKSHLHLSTVAPGGKYLCTVRDVERTVLSWYRFLREQGVPDVMQCDTASDFAFSKGRVLEAMCFGGPVWQYYREFYQCLDLPNVLVLVFEDLERDLDGHLDVIADFIGVSRPVGDARVRILELCSKEGMAATPSKYDGTWTYEQVKRIGRNKDPSSFIPAPRVHTQPSKEVLNDAAQEVLALRWNEEITKTVGLPDYASLQQAVRTELKKRCMANASA